MTAEDIYRAQHAQQLLGDDLFAEMLTEVRVDALNALAECDATDADAIRHQQAIVAVTGAIRDKLTAVVLKTGQGDGGMSAQNSPKGE